MFAVTCKIGVRLVLVLEDSELEIQYGTSIEKQREGLEVV
jgi:hypothetical protein